MDLYVGTALWSFDNAEFTEDMIGGTITITGSPEPEFNDTFTILTVPSATTVTMSPEPIALGPLPIGAATITLTVAPAPEYTEGPGITGVTLEIGVKRGVKKLGSSAATTPE